MRVYSVLERFQRVPLFPRMEENMLLASVGCLSMTSLH